MSALLELIKEAPPEDRKAAAEMLKPYFDEPAKDKPVLPQLISLDEFQKKHKIKKAPDWLWGLFLAAVLLILLLRYAPQSMYTDAKKDADGDDIDVQETN